MDYRSLLQKALPHFVAIIIMLIISSLYFYPAIEGKSLQGHDVMMNYGKWREIFDFRDFEDQKPLWNGAIFSGMPEFLSTSYQGSDQLTNVFYFPTKIGLPLEVASLFWYMLGFYILMVSLGISPWLAIAGAAGFALSSYNIIIIGAGHYKKVHTIALIAPTLAGILLVLKRKYIIGFLLTTLFLALQIVIGHVQMTYYFGFGVLFILLFEAYYAYREKRLQSYFLAGGILVASAALALSCNYAKLINMYDYNEHTIRGGRDLNEGAQNSEASGLDKDYIYAWSSGVDETMMIFLPEVNGGKSQAVSQNKSLLSKVPPQDRQTLGGINQYWGDQPFSGGPNYIGVVFVFLFFLGLFVMKHRLKWPVLITVVLYILLSMGNSFQAFSDLFVENVPLFNKFRAPVSILGIAAIFIPFFAILTLWNMVRNPSIMSRKVKVPGLSKTYPVLNVAAVVWFIFLAMLLAMPTTFVDFFSQGEKDQINSMLQQADGGGRILEIRETIENFRISIFRGDVWRAILFSLLAFLPLYFFNRKKFNGTWVIAILSLLIVVDVWMIGRDYVPTSEFTRKSATKEAHRLTEIDRQIYNMEMNRNPSIRTRLEQLTQELPSRTNAEKDRLLTYAVNTGTHYRVYNLTQSTFNENTTSNAHRSVGGYHAAKLSRYQELIENQISKSNIEVLNMLNARYIITKEGLRTNQEALGPAWFVQEAIPAENAREEMDKLSEIDPSQTAVLASTDYQSLPPFQPATSADKIRISSIASDLLKYKYSASGDRLLVFSEIYYPGWKLYVDEEEVELFHVNYVLRAAVVPSGEHELTMKFDPDIYYESNRISKIAFILTLLIFVSLISWSVYVYVQKMQKSPAKG